MIIQGYSVNSAGDVNGDSIDDLIIGAYGAESNAGKSYVIYGSRVNLPTSLNLSDLDSENGFIINGESANDISGVSVSSAGDVNGDGIYDLIIGASGADWDAGSDSGKSYVIFGSDDENGLPIPNPLNLSTLDARNGFVINGENAGDFSGHSVSSAGDVNGDGIDDLIIGAPSAESSTGKSYVVFGSRVSSHYPLNLSDLNGENANDLSGFSVSSAGDLNKDGFNDIIIGASFADPDAHSDAGKTYVIFGKSGLFSSPLNLTDLNTNFQNGGVVINGEHTFDESGFSVSSAGDINGDGVDDLIIGAPGGGVNAHSSAGKSYVVFGMENSDVIFETGFE